MSLSRSPLNGSGGRSKPNSTSPLLYITVALLLLGQFFFTNSCQRQFGTALLEGYTKSFNSLAASVGYSDYTFAPREDSSAETGILTGHFDVCIAGAGLSGSVLAERYASQLNKKVLVVEKRDHIGGNCYDYKDADTDIRVSQYGAHLFHTYFEDVWNYVRNFGPWSPYEHKVRGIVNGKVVPIPVNIETVNTLFDLNLQTSEQMDQWLQNEQVPVPNGREPQNSEEVALSRVGQRLYDLIFKPYTFKQWNKYPAELGPEVLQRIPVRNDHDERYFSDPHQALPTNGYTSLFENMLKSRYITVLTNTDYFKIRDQVSCGKHYFTGPIDAYFAHHNLPKLEYRSLDFERRVALNTPFFQPAFVINHPQDNDDYTRIVEYKHLYGQAHLPHTVYFIERSSDYGEPYYPVPNQRNKDLFAQYQLLARQEEQAKNVSFVGRLANYKYFNMDQAIKNALDLFEKDTGIPYQMVDHNPPGMALERLKFAPAVAADDKRTFPDWWHAVDCSVWDNMCGSAMNLQDRYMPYPFPLSELVKNPERFDHQSMDRVPVEWSAALNVDQDLTKPPPRPLQYIYPPEVSADEKQNCLSTALSEDWQDQIDHLFETGRVKSESLTKMVAFTISDYNYAFDMMHEVFEMNDGVVGFRGAFFMVAIDKETLEMACTYGYPVVAWPSSNSKDTSELKHAVANTKFEVSLFLVTRGVHFFFYEMDVWFLKSPKEVIASHHSEDKHDILASSHMNCPMCINIGVFSVTANERSKEYFELCILMAKESPGTHDQWIMSQLLRLAQDYHDFGRPIMKLEGKWEPPPKTNPPPMTNPIFSTFYGSYEIVANERPVPTKDTYAIHPLTASPLQKPFGKKLMAKELGAWTGFSGPNGEAGYYARTGENRRYLWMDGHESPSSFNLMKRDGFHDIPIVQFTMAALLALARRTGRIFVMPKLLADHGVHYLWTILDFEPVEEMGIDFRETNFPHNSKAWHTAAEPFQSVARTAMGPISEDGKEFGMYVQVPSRASDLNNADDDEGEIQAWKFGDDVTESDALDAWWALHTAIPEVDSAELLLVNPNFLTKSYAAKLKRMSVQREGKISVAEKEIIEVYSRLKWCFKNGLPIVVYESIIGRSSAEYACHGKGLPP